MVSTGTVANDAPADAYAFIPNTNLPSPINSSGIIQTVFVPFGGGAFPSHTTAVNGTAASNYDVAAQILSVSFVPYSQTSIFQVEYCISSYQSTANMFINAYLLPALIPGPFASATAYGNSGSFGNTVIGGFTLGPINLTDEFPVALCAFHGGGTTSQYGSPNDYLLITEFSNVGPVTATATCTTVSAAPVLAFSVGPPGPFPASIWVYGTAAFLDAANVASNAQTMSFLMQYNGVSTTCTIGPTNSVAGFPTLQYAVVGTTVNVNVIGAVGYTFLCNFNYTVTQEGV
jgi:hypothetical protein